MKMFRNWWVKKVTLIVVISSIPITVFAVYDTYGYFTTWGGVGTGGASLTSSSFSVGYNNIHSDPYGSNPVNTFSAGKGLIVRDDNSVVVGKYNKVTSGTEAFIVGIGNNSSPGENAFEVYMNGKVIINKPQGDISMGIYQ